MQKEYSPWEKDFTKQWIKVGFEPVPRIIVTAANKSGDFLIVGARHWDSVMRSQASIIPSSDSLVWEQGFIDQYGQFVNRKQAKAIALANNQNLIGEDFGDDLYSENLH